MHCMDIPADQAGTQSRPRPPPITIGSPDVPSRLKLITHQRTMPAQVRIPHTRCAESCQHSHGGMAALSIVVNYPCIS